MRFVNAIFDLDGTLLDTEPVYTEATRQVLAPFGKEFPWELKQRMMGRGAIASARLLIESLSIDLSPEEYLARREPLVEAASAGAPEIAGAGQFLATLAEAGCSLALATSSSRRLCDVKLGDRPWVGLFSAVVCGDDPAVVHPKPAPDIFVEAARRIGADPARTVAFEDSPAGVAAACAAGLTVVAIADPRMDRDRLSGASRIVSDFRGLAEILCQS